jgi:hypothetical protein
VELMIYTRDAAFDGVFCGLFVLLLGGVVAAQQGTAPNNYNPVGYNGSIFSGRVVQTTDDSITLSYVHGSKTDTFEAYTTTPCNLPANKTTTHPVPLSKVQTGAVVTVYYEPKTVKVDGRKQKRNEVVGISFLEVNGRKVSEEHQAIFYCIPGQPTLYFRAFDGR